MKLIASPIGLFSNLQICRESKYFIYGIVWDGSIEPIPSIRKRVSRSSTDRVM